MMTQNHRKTAGATSDPLPDRACPQTGYSLPPDMVWQGGLPPLWLAVAQWCVQKGRAVSRDEIVNAFRVTPKQVANVMNYIITVCRRQVDSVKEVSRGENGRSLRCLRVYRIRAQHEEPATRSDLKRLRNLALGLRRSPGR